MSRYPSLCLLAGTALLAAIAAVPASAQTSLGTSPVGPRGECRSFTLRSATVQGNRRTVDIVYSLTSNRPAATVKVTIGLTVRLSSGGSSSSATVTDWITGDRRDANASFILPSQLPANLAGATAHISLDCVLPGSMGGGF